VEGRLKPGAIQWKWDIGHPLPHEPSTATGAVAYAVRYGDRTGTADPSGLPIPTVYKIVIAGGL
jgi:hypothetical protein